jgi:ABC-type sulfate transport system permease subunit
VVGRRFRQLDRCSSRVGKLGLYGSDCLIAHRRIAVYLAAIVVVRFYVRIVAWVVIIRIIVVRIVRIIVPGKESGIQPTPEAIDKDEKAMMIKVCMPPVPVVVPIRLMTFGGRDLLCY